MQPTNQQIWRLIQQSPEHHTSAGFLHETWGWTDPSPIDRELSIPGYPALNVYIWVCPNRTFLPSSPYNPIIFH